MNWGWVCCAGGARERRKTERERERGGGGRGIKKKTKKNKKNMLGECCLVFVCPMSLHLSTCLWGVWRPSRLEERLRWTDWPPDLLVGDVPRTIPTTGLVDSAHELPADTQGSKVTWRSRVRRGRSTLCRGQSTKWDVIQVKQGLGRG